MHAANNGTNAIVEFLQQRQSANHKQLELPAPDSQQLAQILQCAMSAPDHGRLQPWRYLYIQGEARHALGKVFADCAQQNANAKGLFISTEKLNQLRNKPLRAPLIIVAISQQHPQSAVPRDEQLLSAAAGVQQIMLAGDALGFASIWLSGAISHERAVRAALGIGENEQIIGFIYMGTSTSSTRPGKRPDYQQFCQEWHGADV